MFWVPLQRKKFKFWSCIAMLCRDTCLRSICNIASVSYWSGLMEGWTESISWCVRVNWICFCSRWEIARAGWKIITSLESQTHCSNFWMMESSPYYTIESMRTKIQYCRECWLQNKGNRCSSLNQNVVPTCLQEEVLLSWDTVCV